MMEDNFDMSHLCDRQGSLEESGVQTFFLISTNLPILMTKIKIIIKMLLKIT